MVAVQWMLTFLIAGSGLIFAIYGIPQLVRWLQVRRWNTRRDCIALTYDDGPDGHTTPALLDLLDEKGVRATFYLVGFRAAKCPAEMVRLRASGHELGAHSHNHLHAWKTWPWIEYQDAHRGYRSLAIEPESPFRPPFGKITLPTLLSMWLKGRRVQWWSVATNDTDEALGNPQAMADRVLDSGKTVILMHCHHDDADKRAFVLEMTRALIDGGRARGIEFVTMDELSGAEAGVTGAIP